MLDLYKPFQNFLKTFSSSYNLKEFLHNKKFDIFAKIHHTNFVKKNFKA